MLELNSALRDALQAAADDEVHVERLLDGARSRGLRYRRRRHVTALGGAVLSVALLLGAGVWAVFLSLPYVWPLLVAGLLVTSLGLALTARYRLGWKRTQSI